LTNIGIPGAVAGPAGDASEVHGAAKESNAATLAKRFRFLGKMGFLRG
jgi:hypothetical protein